LCSCCDQEKYAGPFNSWLYDPLELAQKQVMDVIFKFRANLLNDDRASMFWVDIDDDIHRMLQKIDHELENDDDFVHEIYAHAWKAYRKRASAHNLNMKSMDLMTMGNVLQHGLPLKLSNRYNGYKDKWTTPRQSVQTGPNGGSKLGLCPNRRYIGFTKYFLTKVMWMMCIRKGISYRFCVDNESTVTLVDFREHSEVDMPWWNVDFSHITQAGAPMHGIMDSNDDGEPLIGPVHPDRVQEVMRAQTENARRTAAVFLRAAERNAAAIPGPCEGAPWRKRAKAPKDEEASEPVARRRIDSASHASPSRGPSTVSARSRRSRYGNHATG
jgi:hypothetical protein